MASRTIGHERQYCRTSALLAWMRLARVSQKIEHALAEHVREWGLSLAQFDLLAQVGAHEGLTQGEVARALLVTKGNVCQLLDRMERDGLIKRNQAGRTNQLVLTEEGRRLYDEVMPAQEALITRLFSTLTSEEQVQLLGVLRKLDHGLEPAEHTGET